jgi:hypothetical protein
VTSRHPARPPRTRRSYRLPVAVLAACTGAAVTVSAGVGWAQPTQPEQHEQLHYVYGVDSSSWFWEPQVDEELALGPVSQRTSLPSPQSQDTLPVAVEAGEPTKISALRFDLRHRGVPDGSPVTGFVLTIAEGAADAGDMVATFNPMEHEIQACAATEPFSPGEADLWEAQPAFDDDCVVGVRGEPELDDDSEDLDTYWTFDLTPLAASWGKSTFDNHGVVFTPVLPEDAGLTDSWQVNLKIPQRNDVNTPVDEYEETVERVSVELSYLPGEPDDPAGPADAVVGSPQSSAVTTGAGGGVPDRGAPPEPVDLPGDDHDADAVAQPVSLGEPFEPRMPWYVWLLVPVALLAAALVRGALVEAPATTRTSGVIEAIRHTNARRRGGPLATPGSALARIRATMPFGGR